MLPCQTMQWCWEIWRFADSTGWILFSADRFRWRNRFCFGQVPQALKNHPNQVSCGLTIFSAVSFVIDIIWARLQAWIFRLSNWITRTMFPFSLIFSNKEHAQISQHVDLFFFSWFALFPDPFTGLSGRRPFDQSPAWASAPLWHSGCCWCFKTQGENFLSTYFPQKCASGGRDGPLNEVNHIA